MVNNGFEIDEKHALKYYFVLVHDSLFIKGIFPNNFPSLVK